MFRNDQFGFDPSTEDVLKFSLSVTGGLTDGKRVRGIFLDIVTDLIWFIAKFYKKYVRLWNKIIYKLLV